MKRMTAGSIELARFVAGLRHVLPLLAMACLLGPVGAMAQTRWSLLDSAESPVRYTEANTKPVRSCESLIEHGDFDVSVVAAEVIPADADAPQHCRVFAVIRPEIRARINLPMAWNNRLYAIGEGGFGGHEADYPLFGRWQARALSHGFATAYNDTGHDDRLGGGKETLFAYNSLEREIDFGFRARHLTTVVAKRLIELFYGKRPDYSYFDGCSNGGREAMIAAQRFPDDYDGIVAGAAALDITGMMIQLRQVNEALEKIHITPRRLELLSEAVYRRCDHIDGLVDGVLRDPRQCDFEPARDLPRCNGAPDDTCFTTEQIEGLELLYAPVVVDGKRLYPGAPFGAEPKDDAGRSGWVPRFMNIAPDGTRQPPLMEKRLVQWLHYLAFEIDMPDMDWREFNLESDIPKLWRSSAVLDATDPDLSRLADSGGKLIAYHGWADTGPNPLRVAEYFDEVRKTMGMRADSTARLFMVPGMFHCNGGYGVHRIDTMTALINWVERDVPPDQIVATKLLDDKVVQSQPVCAYPRVAAYDGKGDPKLAANFSCVDPPGPRRR